MVVSASTNQVWNKITIGSYAHVICHSESDTSSVKKMFIWNASIWVGGPCIFKGGVNLQESVAIFKRVLQSSRECCNGASMVDKTGIFYVWKCHWKLTAALKPDQLKIERMLLNQSVDRCAKISPVIVLGQSVSNAFIETKQQSSSRKLCAMKWGDILRFQNYTLLMFCLLNSQMNTCEPNPKTTSSDFNRWKSVTKIFCFHAISTDICLLF